MITDHLFLQHYKIRPTTVLAVIAFCNVPSEIWFRNEKTWYKKLYSNSNFANPYGKIWVKSFNKDVHTLVIVRKKDLPISCQAFIVEEFLYRDLNENKKL